MAKFFINKRYVTNQDTPINMDFIVSGKMNGDKIELSITNQLSFQVETWTDNAIDYLEVQYVKGVGYKLVA